jgi:cyclophilin family peptidyl-prolyl cis-trans isomerase
MFKNSTSRVAFAMTIIVVAVAVGAYFFFFYKDDIDNGADDVLKQEIKEFVDAPVSTVADYNDMALPKSLKTYAVMKTNFGDIVLELFPKQAPKTVENFVKLSRDGFYNTTKFHRVIKGFMIQGGDPNSKDDDWSNDGSGGPGYQFEDEINQIKIVKGVLAMANSGPNTNGSQFFIVTADATPWLDGKHTVFGGVVEGMDVVLAIENTETDKTKGDHPVEDVIVNSIEIVEI